MDDERLRRHRGDNLRQTVLLLGGLGLLLAGVGFVVAGRVGVALALGFAALVGVAGPTVSPRLVLRLYKARPLARAAAPELVAVVDELSRRAGLKRAPSLHYVPSRALNAFAVGAGDDAALAVTDGLLRTLDGRELAGVLAHEVGHVKNGDTRVMALADVVTRVTGVLASAAQFALPFAFLLALGGMASTRFLAGLAILLFAPTVAGLLQLALSRSREFDADLEAAELTGRPEWLAGALDRMERTQGGWLERLFFNRRTTSIPSWMRTHPTTEERVERLLALVPPDRFRPMAAPARFAPRDREVVVVAPRRRRLSGIWV